MESDQSWVNTRIQQSDAWAREHRDLLIAAFLTFRREGQWPLLEDLQHQFEKSGKSDDVALLAAQMPSALGFVDRQRLVLQIRGLMHVPAAKGLVQDWYTAIALAYVRWLDDREARLTKRQVAEVFGGDAGRTLAVSRVLLQEGWPFGSGYGEAGDDWWREITSRVRYAREASSAEEVIAARDNVETPTVPAGKGAGDQSGLGRGFRRRCKAMARMVSGNPLWASLVATVVGGLILTLILAPFKENGGAPEDPSSAGFNETQLQPQGNLPETDRTYKEQAGSQGARAFSQPAGAVEGPRVRPYEYVFVTCRVYAPEPPTVVPDGYWYRLASSPWKGRYYAPANSFWNGDIPGKKPYTHYTDFDVPVC